MLKTLSTLPLRRAALLSLLALLAPACGLEPFPDPSAADNDAVAASARGACAFAPGALASVTQGRSNPHGAGVPVDHIIVLMQENRSFDHYFQKLPEYGQPDVEVTPPRFVNRSAAGQLIKPFHAAEECMVDTAHSWSAVDRQVNGGLMDGFALASEGYHEDPGQKWLSKEMLSGDRALSYYDATDLPFYYWLASEFAIADHYHSSMPGPTWPNRMFLYAASSFGIIRNTQADASATIFDKLSARNIDFRIYANQKPSVPFYAQDLERYRDHLQPIKSYFTDVAADALPSVVFFDPILGTNDADSDDEHPPAMVSIGQRFVAKAIDALTRSSLWPRSVLFLTYDEHGGLFDHVPPPAACAPDDHAPLARKSDPQKGFTTLGIRVPLIAVSPYAKRHFVGHHVYDHTSLLRFIEARFELPALSRRDANAEVPWELFDFDAPPHLLPPAIVIPTVDRKKADLCSKLFND